MASRTLTIESVKWAHRADVPSTAQEPQDSTGGEHIIPAGHLDSISSSAPPWDAGQGQAGRGAWVGPWVHVWIGILTLPLASDDISESESFPV